MKDIASNRKTGGLSPSGLATAVVSLLAASPLGVTPAGAGGGSVAATLLFDGAFTPGCSGELGTSLVVTESLSGGSASNNCFDEDFFLFAKRFFLFAKRKVYPSARQ
jgi:hypothetical protein